MSQENPGKSEIVQKFEVKKDARGNLVELFKFPEYGQIVYSTSGPGVIRGNHYHTRKVEKFCVIDGKAKMRIRNRDTGEVQEFLVSGEEPCTIEMRPYHTHNIENIGDTEMKLVIWVNELFNPEDPDTFPELV